MLLMVIGLRLGQFGRDLRGCLKGSIYEKIFIDFYVFVAWCRHWCWSMAWNSI